MFRLRATYSLIVDEYICRRQGMIEVKDKGVMAIWYVVNENAAEPT